MAGPLRVRVGILALVVAGCSSEASPVPEACTHDAAAIVQALGRAPAQVTLADGTRISTCIGRAQTSADLQSVSVTLTQVADQLRERVAGDAEGAVALGYLAGAVQRGAAASEDGVAAQLAARIEHVAGRIDGVPAAHAAMARGRQAGQRSG